MGKLSLTIASAIMLVSSSVWSIAPKEKVEVKTLSEQIHQILAQNSIYVKNKDLTARVLFTLNEDKRIVILAIKTDYWDVKGFLNRRLDKKKMDIAHFEVGEQFVVDVRLTS
ncbi:hypothetical protein ACOKFD_06455 [Flagellimonas sp. S174]|uniref:hypothetical protein n=1 Tax=Flagellimonas sp. S174 TaxID=3410790 RepID=UPI003BF5F1C4